jgi:hypothetical protein
MSNKAKELALEVVACSGFVAFCFWGMSQTMYW